MNRYQKRFKTRLCLSPDLFSLYSQKVMDELDDLEGVGGVNVNYIRYADDTVLIVDTEEKPQDLVDMRCREHADRGLTINVGTGKTELPVTIMLEGRQMTQVDQYKYLK